MQSASSVRLSLRPPARPFLSTLSFVLLYRVAFDPDLLQILYGHDHSLPRIEVQGHIGQGQISKRGRRSFG